MVVVAIAVVVVVVMVVAKDVGLTCFVVQNLRCWVDFQVSTSPISFRRYKVVRFRISETILMFLSKSAWQENGIGNSIYRTSQTRLIFKARYLLGQVYERFRANHTMHLTMTHDTTRHESTRHPSRIC